MGTWGPGAFENDFALDWAGSTLPSVAGFHELVQVLASDLADEQTGQVVVAACEVVAGSRGHPPAPCPNEVLSWVAENRPASEVESASAVEAVDRVNGQSSALADSWSSSPNRVEWGASLEDLRRRLRLRPKRPPSPRRRRPKIELGDVVEVKLANGRFAYVQLVGDPVLRVQLLRALPGTYAERARGDRLWDLVSGATSYLGLGFTQPWFEWGELVGRFPVPEQCQRVQYFRTFVLPSEENPAGWMITDSDGRTVTGVEFTAAHPGLDQRELPSTRVAFPARWRWLLEVGWHPRQARSGTDDWWSE